MLAPRSVLDSPKALGLARVMAPAKPLVVQREEETVHDWDCSMEVVMVPPKDGYSASNLGKAKARHLVRSLGGPTAIALVLHSADWSGERRVNLLEQQMGK